MEAIQTVKDYWDRRPCNIRHSPAPIGTKDYFDQVEARRYFIEPHIPAFANFEKWKGKKVLEVGCGIGTDSINFARAGADLTVVDVSGKSLIICKQRFDVYGLKAKFYLANVEELSANIPIEPYDLIYSFGVIHHTPNPSLAIQELKKFCGPQTQLRLMLYSKWCWKVFWIITKYGHGAFWKANELIAKYSEAQEGCPYTSFYSKRDVRKLLTGFKIEKLWKNHIFAYQIDKYIRYEYELTWYFRYMPAFLFNWFKHNFGWHTLIIAKPEI